MSQCIVSGVSLAVPYANQPISTRFKYTWSELCKNQCMIQPISDNALKALQAVNIAQKKNGTHVVDPKLLPGFANGFPARVHVPSIPVRAKQILSVSSQVAIAAGVRACQDAQLLDTDGLLPEDYRDRTGIILASSFDGEEHVRRGADRKFILRLLATADTQLAEIIQARGPTLQIKNACASTTCALIVASDWLRARRCDRVIVISADDPCQPDVWPIIAAGFTSLGATSHKPSTAFSRLRSGITLGSAGVGFVLEQNYSLYKRLPQTKRVVALTGTRMCNSAYHACALHQTHLNNMFNHFWQQHPDVNPAETVYYSHETGTHGPNSCANTEANMLLSALGDTLAGQLWITNTKALTGHTMGCGVEDAMCIFTLRHQQVPSVKLQELDPQFAQLRFVSATHQPQQIHNAIRFAAGFGSHSAVVLFQVQHLQTPLIPIPRFLQPTVTRHKAKTVWFPGSIIQESTQCRIL